MQHCSLLLITDSGTLLPLYMLHRLLKVSLTLLVSHSSPDLLMDSPAKPLDSSPSSTCDSGCGSCGASSEILPKP
jgi:hypothetical protein